MQFTHYINHFISPIQNRSPNKTWLLHAVSKVRASVPREVGTQLPDQFWTTSWVVCNVWSIDFEWCDVFAEMIGAGLFFHFFYCLIQSASFKKNSFGQPLEFWRFGSETNDAKCWEELQHPIPFAQHWMFEGITIIISHQGLMLLPPLLFF